MKLSDRICYCGQQNCVETFLSGPGLAKTTKELLGREIANESLAGSTEGEAVLDLYASMLARSLAYVVNIIDPEVIVLGGGLSNISRLYQTVPKLLQQYAFSTEGLTKVVPAEHGDSSGSRGAAWLF